MEEEFQDGLEKAPLFEDSASQQENLQKISEYVAPIGERGYSTLIDGQGGRKELEVSAGTMVTADGLITLPDGIAINQKGEIYKTDGSIWDLYGNVIRPETPVIEIAETSGENNKVKAVSVQQMVQWKRGGGNCADSGTAPDSKSICEKK